MTPTADWFAARTTACDDYDPAELSVRKKELGLRVSVVLPARNEAPTVEGVIAACQELDGSLVDEIVVIDGGSDDGTPELAEEAGVRVVRDLDVHAEHGPSRGKGDGLWRSLSVTSGDLVVFVDTDIRNPDPRFVWGLLGPLLTTPEVSLVKAFYDRPLEVAGTLQPSGGGRVTELLARPLLNLWWPQLAGLVQPLSGEYAGRRDLLERLPFFTGYGVELGMLIDTLEAEGPEAIAQVDLGVRVHRNQSLEALSRMAYGVLQVAGQRKGVDASEQAAPYAQFTRTDDGVELVPHQVDVVERPPYLP